MAKVGNGNGKAARTAPKPDSSGFVAGTAARAGGGVDFTTPAIPPWHPAEELGAAGLIQWSGIVREELLPKLQGVLAIRAFREMSDNDPVIGASLSAIDLLTRRVPWHVEAGGKGSEDQAAKEFLETVMDDMAHTWTDHISEAMSMIVYGWSLFEIVYKARNGPDTDPHKNSRYNDGKIGVRKLGIRAQDTLFRWVFDGNGGLQAMIQRPAPDYYERIIPIDKAILYRIAMRKNNPESRSVLRTAYRPWWFKKRIEEFQAVGIERNLAGLPFIGVPPQLLSATPSSGDGNLLAQIKKIGQNVRNDEQACVIFPLAYDPTTHLPLFDFKLLTAAGGAGQKATEALAAINYYDQRMAIALFTDFLLIGHGGGSSRGASGSYAMAEAKINSFSAAMNAYLNSIQDTLNRYLVPRLFALNGWDLETLPTFTHEPVEQVDLQSLGQFINNLAGAGMTIFPTQSGELERQLLSRANLPEDLAKPLPEPVASVANSKPGADGAQEPGGGKPTRPKKPAGQQSTVEG